MIHIYLTRRLEYRGGATLSAHIPYNATFDPERNLYVIHLKGNNLAVQPKHVERVVDNN